MAELGICCVADQFCLAAANFDPPTYVKSKCFACGDFVCENCSIETDYYGYGKVRLCHNCRTDYDGNREAVMNRLHELAGYPVRHKEKMAVRQLTDSERKAMDAARNELLEGINLDSIKPIMAISAAHRSGFIAGLDVQQARLDNQEAALGSCREAFEHLEADNKQLIESLYKTAESLTIVNADNGKLSAQIAALTADNARLRAAVTQLMAYVSGEVPLSEIEGIVAEMRRVVDNPTN